MRERGSEGMTEQSEGDRNHTPRETDGDKWTKSHREKGEEGETEREDGERVRRSEGSAAAAEVTDPHPLPFAHIAPQGLQSTGPGLESGPFLETRRVSPGGPTLPRAPGTVRDYLQAGPGPGCLSHHSTWHMAAPQPMLDKLNSTQRALGSQSFQPRH